MSTQLDPNCKKQLIEFTRDVLNDVTVKNGKFLHDPSTFKLILADIKKLPDKGKLRASLESYISETPFSDFIRESLARELSDTAPWQSDDTLASLSSIDGFTDTDATASRLVDKFESLPWTHQLTLALPDAIGIPMLEAMGPTDFSDTIRLVALDDAFKEAHPLDSGNRNSNERLGGSLLSLFAAGGVP